MEEESTPFQTYGEILSFYLRSNPARQKFQNLAEPEGGHNDWQNISSDQLFAIIGAAIQKTMRNERPQYRAIWYRRHARTSETGARDKTERVKEQIKESQSRSTQAIAREHGIHERTVSKILRCIRGRLEDEFRSRGLLPPENLKPSNRT